MKRWFTVLVLLLVSTGVMADDMNDAFNTGSSYGKDSAGQGTGSLDNTDVISGAIPGYTSSPSESSSYGGVTGSDGGIADKGQQALSTDDAAAEVISSGNSNPAVTVDPDAPYITNGQSAEDSADSIVDGTNSQCTTTTVSKSTFENYTCSADVEVKATCTRTTVATGHYENQTAVSTISVDPYSWVVSEGDDNTVIFAFPLPAGAKMVSGTMTLVPSKYSISTYKSSIVFPLLNQTTYLPENSMSFTLNVAGITVPSDGYIRGYFTSSYFNSSTFSKGIASSAYPDNPNLLKFEAVITIETTKKVFVADVSTPSVCDNNTGGKLVSSVCSTPGGDKQIVVDGVTQTVHSDCWQYTDTYLVSENTTGTCGDLMKDSACTQSASTCTETTDGQCSHKQYTYQCQTVYSSSGLLCGGTYYCETGDCSDTNGAGDSGFDTAVAKLAGLASAGDDVKDDQVNVKAFTGEAMSCRKAFAGFSNCCKDSGWGQDAGLMQCNSDEKALAAAKAKKITVSVGERCDHSVAGVCLQKSQVYCVFGGKLARIIQEQGRRDQLGIGFGSGASPNCAGITVPQLQAINFDKINFSDFYQDLIDNQKIPNTDSMVAQVKQKIAAQVNQTTGGTTK